MAGNVTNLQARVIVLTLFITVVVLFGEHDFDSLQGIAPKEAQAPDFWTVIRRTNFGLFIWRPCGSCRGCTFLRLDKPPYGPVMVAIRTGMLKSSVMGHADFLIEAEELPYEEILHMANSRSVGFASFQCRTSRN